jgi:RimJ/RimL family protein N-acetyltransferase
MLHTHRLLLRPVSYDGGRPQRWQILDRETEEAVGTIGYVAREPDGALVVGYEITNAHHGHGFATEALVAVLVHAAGQGLAIVAETEADHIASRRVMEKAGMRLREVEPDRVVYASVPSPS